ncbi:MAG: T9SS type A sorting domain-containing protein, partial [Bacteroidia bacterium]|nr:T9SS type A sorting domain-containing protein [Bacteroidia bacterium]
VTYSGMSGTDVLQLTVFDGQSKMVHRSIIRNQDIFEVDIRGYAKGIYYFIVYDGRETKTVKVIKE